MAWGATMKTFNKLTGKLKDENGASMIIVALILTVLLGFIALAVDVGYLYSTKNELQDIADAGALAGARMLGRLYECNGDTVNCPRAMAYSAQLTYSADVSAIKGAVINVAAQNQAGGLSNISINDADIIIGNWNYTSHTIDPVTNTSPDAVGVTARRDGSANGPVTTFFARIFGMDTASISATATAALTGISSIVQGGLPIPVAINKSWLSTLPCNQDLTFHPSSAGTCSGWNSYDGNTYHPNANDMKQLLTALTNRTYQSPATTAYQTQYDFTNGTLASLFTGNYMQDLFTAMKGLNDGLLDQDTNSNTWTTAVAVYDDTTDGCSPNGMITIVGFATITITSVSGPPQSTIYATVQCDNVDPGRGGGGQYGTKGSIPGLVK
jgi:Flp pilus assembly protein TadG